MVLYLSNYGYFGLTWIVDKNTGDKMTTPGLFQRLPLGPNNGYVAPTICPNSRIPSASKLRPPAIKRPLSPVKCSGMNKKSKFDDTLNSTQSSNSYVGSENILKDKVNLSSQKVHENFTTYRNKNSYNHNRSAQGCTSIKPKLTTSKPPPKPVNKVTPITKKLTATTGTVVMHNIPQITKGMGSKSISATAVVGKRKRQTWDLKGRLQDMEVNLLANNVSNESLRTQLTNNNEKITMLERLNEELNNTIKLKESHCSITAQEIIGLKNKIRDKEDELQEISYNYKREIEVLNQTMNCLQKKYDMLTAELQSSQTEATSLRSTITQMNATQSGLHSELSATQLNLNRATDDNVMKMEEINCLKDIIRNHESTIQSLYKKMQEDEMLRRRLHNTIQELKGNIRVFCRVRPLIGDEMLGNNGEIAHMNFPDPEERILEIEKLPGVTINESILNQRKGSTNKYEFKFDCVFDPTTNQAKVFEEISQLIQSALDGYNVCIFAYGQTGSGKTYTMEGPDGDNPETWGMIPRAVQQIFRCARDLESKGWEYEMEASFLEIYNEQIRDLLGSGKDTVKHEIRLVGPKGTDVMVTNLVTIAVTTQKQVGDLLRKASENRATAATQCNERSSRSHSVFRLKLSGQNSLTGESCQGTLNLVDLAGSERLKESGSQGDRLKETQNINRSLSNLGNVIMSLANKEQHIPYRNSKLTHLLQNSLGGNSKTLMFVNVSPKEEHFNETLCSLRFATKVNQCNIGTAQKKVK